MKRLFVVGIGPGKKEYFTAEAMRALEESDVIYGYPVYTELVEPLFPDKDYRTTGMRQETERCLQALQCADGGQTTALVCSGDAGVYGMASPVLELAEEYPDVDICVVAGVTAALSGAAMLLLCKDLQKTCEGFAQGRVLELSTNPIFADEYMKQMLF